ncbi:MAG: class I SAM-dependent methyltransferase [Chloroflexota bacterium]
MNQTQQFYDGLASDYTYIFSDWNEWVRYQADTLHPFLTNLGFPDGATILDTTCGIGTQAIALAIKGYHVRGLDLSPDSIAQAKANAEQFNLIHPITFDVADLLVTPQNPKQYDVVMAMDNPIAHFLTDDDLYTAFTTMKSYLKPNGLLMTSIRDYDDMTQKRPRQSQVSITDHDETRRIIFQVWDWYEDASRYESEMFVLTQTGDAWQTKSHKTSFRAWQRADVTHILAQVGLSDSQWHMPDESGFYQPIVTARLQF